MAGRLMNSDEFKRFLELLSSTSGGEDGGRCYCRLLRKLEGFFTMRGVCDLVGAADETIATAYRRIAEGVHVPNVERYCIGIARNLAKDRLRRERRESEAFLKFIEDLDNDSGEEVERINRVLEPCFEVLEADEKALLVAYCRVVRGRARAEHRRELAAAMNTTVQGLRMRVNRLRETLTECAETRSNNP